MNPEWKQKWIDALRSGNYKQGKSRLRRIDDAYCCMGVLADIGGATWTPSGESYICDLGANGGVLSVLTKSAMKKFGLVNEDGELMIMNDSGESFDKIAAYIERNL